MLTAALSFIIFSGTWKRIVEEWAILSPIQRWAAICAGGAITGVLGAILAYRYFS